MHEREAQQLEEKLVNKETIKSPEKFRTKVSILITGRSGVGKTKVAEKLGGMLGIPPERITKAGQLMREQLGDMVGYKERPLTVDRKLDEMQAQLIRNATFDNPFILEGRMSGVIAAKEKRKAKRKRKEIPIVSFILLGKNEVRFERIWKRWNEHNPNDLKTLKEIKEQTQERERLDKQTWSRVHPEIPNGDPFNTANRDKEGNRIYDYIINTTYLSVQEVTEKMFNILKDAGFVEKQS